MRAGSPRPVDEVEEHRTTEIAPPHHTAGNMPAHARPIRLLEILARFE